MSGQLDTGPTLADRPSDVASWLDEDERSLRERVASFVRDSVMPDAGRFFAHGAWPSELATELGALGVLEQVPGVGEDATALGFALTCLELGAGDLSLARFVGVQSGLVISALAADDRGGAWLPELRAGAAVAAHVAGDRGARPAMTVRRDHRAWVVSGSVRRVFLAAQADVLFVRAAGARGAVGLMVDVDAHGVTIRAARGVHGPVAALVADVALDAVRVDRGGAAIAVDDGTIGAGTPAGWAVLARICGLAGVARACARAVAHAPRACASDPGAATTALRLAERSLRSELMAIHLSRAIDDGRPIGPMLVAAALEGERVTEEVARAAARAVDPAELTERSPVYRYLVATACLPDGERPDGDDVALAAALGVD